MSDERHECYMIACPVCEAKEGEPCQRSLTLGPHKERIDRYQQGAQRFLRDVFGKE